METPPGLKQLRMKPKVDDDDGEGRLACDCMTVDDSTLAPTVTTMTMMMLGHDQQIALGTLPGS